jgi:cellulose synthase/poly-beta-1,6-N-acetylglucosamine synthase-like glycosyltransferase
MVIIKAVFFIGIFIVFYSYAGYGIVLWFLLKLKKKKPSGVSAADELPALTLIVAAYNEENFIEEKIANTLQLDYPREKLEIIFITDGSSDSTPRLAASYERIQVLHEDQRRGKVAAIHRAMAFVKTPVIVFSDANTLLNKTCLLNIARHYSLPEVGGVAGEKKILSAESDSAAGAGEGIYWKYESFLKKLDSELYSVVGAAGELFSIRTELYTYSGDNILLDDFVISLNVCRMGYRVVYEPEAYALETPSASLREEQKRKIRISAGAFQSMLLLKDLLNIFKYGVLSFQYISHRVLRWTLCPALLPVIFLLNILLTATRQGLIYDGLMGCQVIFYAAAITGWIYSNKEIKIKALYVPYYFFFLNLSLYMGYFRYKKGRQSVLWEKAVRVTSRA